MNKKETMFFDRFGDMAEYAYQAATALEHMLVDYTGAASGLVKISEIESACDAVLHEIFQKANVAFVTPIDREDIFLIAKELDNIVDYIDDAAYGFDIFNVKTISPGAKAFVPLIVQATVALKELLREMIHMKTGKAMMDLIIEINRLEAEGDIKYRAAMKKLFTDERDAVDLIKWRAIYDYLENALDACEYVANVIEGVVMKHG
ncbi:MAG: DUF47 family protein [Firmicutes bacterium]|nr:DUF47 family protein [Bacillota bacterium]